MQYVVGIPGAQGAVPLVEVEHAAALAADGATAAPAIESDSVAGLYAHLPGGRWSSVISHAWLHMFGVPEGMRVVPLEGPADGPRVGLVVARSEPQSVLAEALVKVAREAGVRDALDELLRTYLRGHAS